MKALIIKIHYINFNIIIYLFLNFYLFKKDYRQQNHKIIVFIELYNKN